MTPIISRDLNRAWALIVLLTVLSVSVALAGAGIEGAGPVATAAALGTAVFKARLVLDHFLGLKRAGASLWRTAFTASLLVITGGVLAVGLVF